jgi:hypothetical protein
MVQDLLELVQVCRREPVPDFASTVPWQDGASDKDGHIPKLNAGKDQSFLARMLRVAGRRQLGERPRRLDPGPSPRLEKAASLR